MKESINSAERKIIKSKIQEKIVCYSFIVLILVLLISVAIGLIFKTKNFIPENSRLIVSMGIIIVSFAGITGLVYNSIKPNLIELSNGVKDVISGKVTNKSIKTNYSFSMNLISDSKYQPRVCERYIELDGRWFGVSEKDYKNIEIGDRIRIYLSPRTRTLLGFEPRKEEMPPMNPITEDL